MEDHPFIRRPFAPRRMEPCFCGSGRRFKQCCGSMDTAREPPHGVEVLGGFLSPERCRAWCAGLECRPRRRLRVIDAGAGRLAMRLDEGRVTEEVQAGDLRGPIAAKVHRAFEKQIARSTGRRFAWFERPQVLRYGPGGWYDAHADSEHFEPGIGAWVRNMDRDISLLLYLNEDFEGGALEFVNFNYSYRPRAGALVYFPSDSRYAHRALPVTSGVRYVIASWAAFRGAPRVHDTAPAHSIPLGPND